MICIAKKNSESSSVVTTKEFLKRQQKTINKTILKIISKAVMSLSLFEFAGALEIFDSKVLLMGIAVSLLTGLIKLAIPKKARKFVTIFPFFIGIIVSGAYTFFFENATPFTPHTFSIGIQCGIIATIYYVIYDQFFKGGNSEKILLLTTMIGGIIKKEEVKPIVKNILAVLGKSGDAAKEIYEILKGGTAENATAEEIMLVVKNILGTVKS